MKNIKYQNIKNIILDQSLLIMQNFIRFIRVSMIITIAFNNSLKNQE